MFQDRHIPSLAGTEIQLDCAGYVFAGISDKLNAMQRRVVLPFSNKYLGVVKYLVYGSFISDLR